MKKQDAQTVQPHGLVRVAIGSETESCLSYYDQLVEVTEVLRDAQSDVKVKRLDCLDSKACPLEVTYSSL